MDFSFLALTHKTYLYSVYMSCTVKEKKKLFPRFMLEAEKGNNK